MAPVVGCRQRRLVNVRSAAGASPRGMFTYMFIYMYVRGGTGPGASPVWSRKDNRARLVLTPPLPRSPAPPASRTPSTRQSSNTQRPPKMTVDRSARGRGDSPCVLDATWEASGVIGTHTASPFPARHSPSSLSTHPCSTHRQPPYSPARALPLLWACGHGCPGAEMMMHVVAWPGCDVAGGCDEPLCESLRPSDAADDRTAPSRMHDPDRCGGCARPRVTAATA